jgi:hypothetical protein
LSAIDWLSNSVATPVAVAPPGSTGSDIAITATPGLITVTPLGQTLPDNAGLLASDVTGLPKALWGPASSLSIAQRLKAVPSDLLPTPRQLMKTVLLAETEPPIDAGADGALFLRRIDLLLQTGALEEARSLLDIAGLDTPERFRRAFDVALLIGDETRACRALLSQPDISPTYPTRIFCLARNGDWQTAALTLETAENLGILSDQEDALLAKFLDPDIDTPLLPAPRQPSPLVFRMYEAIGEPQSTNALPLAFAHADLRPNNGWKAQIEAAERLARVGSLEANQLLGLYLKQKQSASGGVWDRVKSVSALDDAINAASPEDVVEALEPAGDVMADVDLEVHLAGFFAKKLNEMRLTGEAKSLAFKLGLLHADFAAIARAHTPANPQEAFWKALAMGQADDALSYDATTQSIREGFRTTAPPTRLQSLLDQGRTGEAILRGLTLFSEGAAGDLDQVSDAIALFRALGLEDIARRASLELILLDRRG